MPHSTVSHIKSRRTLYLALSTLTLFFLGLIYAFSMFAAPMCTAFGLEKGAVGLTFNIMMVMFCIGAVVGSQLEKKVGVRGAMIASAVLFFAGFAGTGAFATGSIEVVYLCYGGVPVVASAFARQRFGAKAYPLNLSLANFAITFGSILNVIVQSVVGGDNRLGVFAVMAVLSLIALIDVLPFSKKWNADMKKLEERRASSEAA